MRFFLSLVLLAAACGDDDTPPPDGGPGGSDGTDGVEAALVLGTGVTSFVEVAEGGDVELVNGPQGGWHVNVTMRIYGLDPQELTMRIEGYDAATDESIGIPIERVLTERRVQPEEDHWLRVGDQLIFAIDSPAGVVGRDVRIESRVTTPEGERAEAELVVHVIDEEP